MRQDLKPINITEENMNQTLGHSKGFLAEITAAGRVPYITLNSAAIEFLHDHERMRDWQHFINELCDIARDIAIIDKGISFWDERMYLPRSSIVDRDRSAFVGMLDRYVMRQKVVVELASQRKKWRQNKRLDDVMRLYKVSKRGDGERTSLIKPPNQKGRR